MLLETSPLIVTLFLFIQKIRAHSLHICVQLLSILVFLVSGPVQTVKVLTSKIIHYFFILSLKIAGLVHGSHSGDKVVFPLLLLL